MDMKNDRVRAAVNVALIFTASLLLWSTAAAQNGKVKGVINWTQWRHHDRSDSRFRESDRIAHGLHVGDGA
jgi:hypothetical protein